MTDETDPMPSGFDPASFVGGEEERKPASVAAMRIDEAKAKDDAKPVRVKVKAPFRVVHDATVFIGGDVAQVPPDTANAWIAKHWAEPVAATRTTKQEK